MTPSFQVALACALLLIAVTSNGQITQPLTGGSNVVESMVATPRVNLALFASASSLVRSMAEIHDKFGQYLTSRAASLGVAPAALAACIQIESGGRGFVGSRMIIRFENHVFKPRLANNVLFAQHFAFDPVVTFQGHLFRAATTGAFETFHGNQDKEWTVLQFAQGLNDLKALESASYGAPQIMGFNAQSIGYTNARTMFQAFSNSLEKQMDGMIAFIRGRSTCLAGLRENDFVKFAGCYNGNGKAASYGELILNARNAYNTVLATIGTPATTACTHEGLAGTCSTSCTGGGVFGYVGAQCPGTGNKCCVPAQSCSPSAGVTGSCLDSAVCTDGTTVAGLCPGSAAIKCCVKSATPAPTPNPTPAPTFASCSPDGGLTPGECKPVILCGPGFAPVPGFCAGSASIQCCVRATKAPTKRPTLSPTSTCSYEGLNGYCSSTKTCRETSSMGYASTLTGCGFCCVPAQSCSTGGRCVDTSICPTGASVLSGLCPGSTKIKCCISSAFSIEAGTAPNNDENVAESSASSAVAAGVAVPIVMLATVAAGFLVYKRRNPGLLDQDQPTNNAGTDGRWSVVAHGQGGVTGDNPLFEMSQQQGGNKIAV